jgi:hypothetical protein
MSSVKVRLERFDSPWRARSLLTVLAAISSATSSERPARFSLALMWSYWRSRFLLHVFCGTAISFAFPRNDARQTSELHLRS